jgi:decaprenyl-phosphate phosphoribosyltransferase
MTVSTATSQPHSYRPPHTAHATARAPRGHSVWIRAARVRQWTKNLLVLSAPAAAAISGTRVTAARLPVAFIAFCLLATGTYLLNDVHDADEDRLHPVKRHRPIASGALAPRRALLAAAATILLGLALAAIVNWETFTVAGAYVLLNAAYTIWLRRIAIAELAAISAAFVIRVIAGATAASVATSGAFIAVVAFAALFVASGKRYADFLDPAARPSRAVLDRYSARFLTLVIALACALALATYSAWAFTQPRSGPTLARELTIIPFTLGLLRYAVIVSRGDGGAPEQIMFDDRPLQILGGMWLLMLATGT